MNGKLDTARVFERIFEIYRDQFTLLIPAALVVFVPVAIVNGIVYAGDVSLAGVLLILVLGTIASYWFQGMVVEAARDILDGRRDYQVSTLLRSAAPVIVPLFLAGVLAGLAFLIGFLLFVIPGLIVLTFFAVVAPVIVIERPGVIDAFRRSIELVRGTALQVFGVIVVLFLLQFIVGAVIQAIANDVADSFVGYALADLIVRLLVAPLSALAAAVMYFELKSLHSEPVAATPAATAAAAARSAAASLTPSGRWRRPLRPRTAPRVPARSRSDPRCAVRSRRGCARGRSRHRTASAFSHPSSHENRSSRVTSAWNCRPHAGFPSMRNA